MSSTNRRCRVLLAGILTMLLTGSLAFAQGVSTASIAGTVRDESGASLPGVTVTATQTATGLARTVVTDDSGGYTLPSLPVGPYRLEFTLDGFRTFVQTGIVLEVNSNPTINATMAIGGLAETVTVEAAAPLIETRNPGVGTVIDNERVVELPLNGRQTLDLVMLTGMAAPSGTLGGARGSSASTTISVAGGLANATTYILDGGTHNDVFNNAAMPFPFPEALQEFKVETSALPAQYGYHSAAAVNAITKSGTNTFSGSLFEFYRDDALNAKDPFAPIGTDGKRRGDGLNRNQFGAAVGGPLTEDRLFYFAGYQRTRIRRTPTSTFQFVPTPAMMAGDFTAFASPACNAGRQVTLRGPFVNNRIDPALFSPASAKLVGMIPAPADPCGRLFFDRRQDSDEHQFVTKVDYSVTNNHSIFGRLQFTKYDTPGDYDGSTLMSYSQSVFQNRVYSLVVGDTTIFGNAVNALRVTFNRGDYNRFHVPLLDYTDLGINATPMVPDYLRMTVTGGFSLMGGGALPGETPTSTYQVADDVSIIRGQHQFGLGANYIYSKYDSISNLGATGNVTFTGQVTGLGLADFLLGRAAAFTQGIPSGLSLRQHYIGIFAQDSWRISPKFTLNAGLRWEPYIPANTSDGEITHFEMDRYTQGLRSTVFPNAPVGLMFPGDDGYPGSKVARNDFTQIAPRVSVVWDPRGEGRQTLRASVGRFYDLPHMQAFGSLPQQAPFGNTINVTDLPRGWDDPYVAYPGGNPMPITVQRDMQFPAFANYVSFPLDLKATNMDQWNVSYQHQLADNWMASANYLGSYTRHVWTANQINPAVYLPGASTVGNTNQRRVLYLQNSVEGRAFASVQVVDDQGTADYHALLLSVQRRRADGISVQGNYTVSRCITDLQNYEPGIANNPYMIPWDREADRGHCANSADHNVNVSAVYAVPAAGDAGLVRALTEGWQLSAIFSARSGSYLTVTTGVDNALSGQPAQRADQLLDDPFMPNRTFNQWLNPAAFQAPVQGTYGTMPIGAFEGPGRWNVDVALMRALGLLGQQELQFRLEAFNVFNHVNPGNPVTTLNNPNFGQITSAVTEPRVLQLAVKYTF